MMHWTFVTLCLALLVYEGVALTTRASGDTISEIIWNVAATRPLIPFLAGLLCGHFFWQRVP